MNEAESPIPETGPEGVTSGQAGHPQSDDGLPESVAHLNAAKTPVPSLAGDVLHGGNEIAGFLYGDTKFRRKVYNLAETARLPIFRLGVNICARKSALLNWITRQEAEGVADHCRLKPRRERPQG